MLTNKQVGEYYFNLNDLKILLDIGLREIQTNQSTRVRTEALGVVQAILMHPTYSKDNYRLEDI